jgi:hypothetical protein
MKVEKFMKQPATALEAKPDSWPVRPLAQKPLIFNALRIGYFVESDIALRRRDGISIISAGYGTDCTSHN